MTLLENTLLQYEKDFFNADFCRNINNIESRLCFDFCEYGKSGAIYNRSDMIGFLLNARENRDIAIYNFSAVKLSGKVIIVHYLSHDKSANQYALRTSIWKHENDNWKMFFHQGTSCDRKNISAEGNSWAK